MTSFSAFRSSLAAKAYIEIEREFARLTLMVEEDILKWAKHILQSAD